MYCRNTVVSHPILSIHGRLIKSLFSVLVVKGFGSLSEVADGFHFLLNKWTGIQWGVGGAQPSVDASSPDR